MYIRVLVSAFVVTTASGWSSVSADQTSRSVTPTILAAPADSDSTDHAGVDQAAVDMTGLEATVDPPWNPAHPIPRREAWERALLFPGRLVTLPLSGLGVLADRSLLYVEEKALGPKATYVAADLTRRTGVSVRPSSLGDDTGLGLTGEFRTRQDWFKERFQLGFQQSSTAQNYHRTRFDITGKPATIAYQYDWRPREDFFGLGIDSPKDGRSNYAAHTESVMGRLHWGWNVDDDSSRARTNLSVWTGPRSTVMRTGRDPGVPSIEQQYPVVAEGTLNRTIDHFMYGASFASDWRTGQPHWSQGWRVFVSAERFDQPIKALALHTGEERGAQFTRYRVETETGRSFGRDPRTLRFLVKFMDQQVGSGADRFLVSDLAQLGGSEGLSAFRAGRFHDIDFVLGRISYVIPLVRRLELEMHHDMGAVYHDIWEDAKFNTLETSSGLAVRGRTDKYPLGSIGFDFTHNAIRFRFTYGRVE
jgi:hypothetical protein